MLRLSRSSPILLRGVQLQVRHSTLPSATASPSYDHNPLTLDAAIKQGEGGKVRPAPRTGGVASEGEGAGEVVTDEDTRVRAADEALAAGVVNGVPPEMFHRPVRIYRPTKNAMQSAKGDGQHWRLDWDRLSGSGSWENPLMGWSSSLAGTRLKFPTKDAAIAFCERQGWDYYVQQTFVKELGPKSYSDNFKHVPGELRKIPTK
ncbi:hypothetical protein BT69DRAFT_1280270 [Atractiella rhizophila]|nr:hypothetical protein BT69DRAFT_1280270 [Atractiella rhizophila]